MPSHNLNISTSIGQYGQNNYSPFNDQAALPPTISSTDFTGGDQPHNNMQPYAIFNYIIKSENNANNTYNNSSSSVDSATVQEMISSAINNNDAISSTNLIPSFLMNTKNGQSGFYSTENSFLYSGEYDDLFIYSNDIVNINPSSTTVIYVKDTCMINGFIDGRGANNSGGTNLSNASANNTIHFMASGGGTGGGQSSWGGALNNIDMSSESGSIQLSINTYFNINSLGGNIDASFDELSDAIFVFPYLHGGDGGPSYHVPGGNLLCCKNGGQGGAGLYIICNTLIFNGTIDVSGEMVFHVSKVLMVTMLLAAVEVAR